MPLYILAVCLSFLLYLAGWSLSRSVYAAPPSSAVRAASERPTRTVHRDASADQRSASSAA